jgi:NADH-quinone oxidoreductase subunit B
MEGLMLLAESVGKERRPLTWTIGDQGIIKPEKISIKERKQHIRQAMTSFRSPDEI